MVNSSNAALAAALLLSSNVGAFTVLPPRSSSRSNVALMQHIGAGGMADTRNPDAKEDEDPRKSISAAPSFEEYLKQRAGEGTTTAAAAPAAAPAPAATPATPAASTPASASYIPASRVTREADGSTSGMDLTGNTWKPDSEKMGSTDTGDYFPEGYDPSQEVAFSVGMEGSQGFGKGDRGPQLPGMENLGEDALLMGGIEENSEIPDGMEFTMSSVPDGQVSMQVGSTSKGAEITIQVKPVCMGYEDYFAAFTADSHPSFSVSPCAGRMDRRGGETTDLTIKCVPAGQSGDLVGNLVINLPEDNSKICYVVTAQSF